MVGFGAGTGLDLYARIIGQRLSERLAQAVIIDNRPGAGSNLATEAVVNAPSDGYTLLMASTAAFTNPALYTTCASISSVTSCRSRASAAAPLSWWSIRRSRQKRSRSSSPTPSIKAMKPGMTFADLVAVMEEPLKSLGCWGFTPLVHSLGPHFLAGRTTVNQEQAKLDVRFAGASAVRARQAVLQPGMFAFEPNACLGHHRVNMGGTVIVTATGCEELNRIPTSVAYKQ